MTRRRTASVRQCETQKMGDIALPLSTYLPSPNRTMLLVQMELLQQFCKLTGDIQFGLLEAIYQAEYVLLTSLLGSLSFSFPRDQKTTGKQITTISCFQAKVAVNNNMTDLNRSY